MFLWQVFEWCLMAVVFIIIITQITLPPLFGKPFFWAFRKSQRAVQKAEVERSDVENISQAQEISIQAQEILNEIEKRKKRTRAKS